MAASLARMWWAFALRGLVGLLVGIGALIWPGPTLTALLALIGPYVLAAGTLAVVAAVRTAEVGGPWWPLALKGVLDVSVTALTVAWPAGTAGALALVYLWAAWALLTGALGVLVAVRLRRALSGGWLLGLGGVLSALLRLLLALSPEGGALAFTRLAGVYALVTGAVFTWLGLRLARGPAQPGARRLREVVVRDDLVHAPHAP